MELSEHIFERLSKIKDANGEPIKVDKIDSVIRDLIIIFTQHAYAIEESLYEEIKKIGITAHEAQSEFTPAPKKNGNADGDGNVINSASTELDAVIESTEEATNKILDSTESIQNIISNEHTPESFQDISNHIMVIFEACNFQDITGQRIKKISKALNFIEESVGHILENHHFDDADGDVRSDADLMSGPQNNDDTPSQDDIDKLFDSV